MEKKLRAALRAEQNLGSILLSGPFYTPACAELSSPLAGAQRLTLRSSKHS